MLGLLGWGTRKKTRVPRTEPEGIAEIRRQEMGKQSTKDGDGGKAAEESGNKQGRKTEEETITVSATGQGG